MTYEHPKPVINADSDTPGNGDFDIPKSIFQESWWLDITAQGKWGEVFHESKFGRVHFSYACRKRYRFFNEIYLPPLTPYTGFYFELCSRIDGPTKYKMLAEAVPSIVDQLPDFHRLKTNMLPEFDWWSPLYWEGFNQYTRYTSLLKGIGDLDSVWSGFNTNTRRNIGKAEKKLTIEKSMDGAALYRLFEKTLNHQNRKPGYPKQRLQQICQELEARKQGQVFLALDEHGVPHAGLLLVWDQHTAYYLVGGSNPNLRNSGAMPLAMWHAIQDASNRVDRFDFEGSMQKGIDRFVRGFGAIPTPYSSISKGLFSNRIVRQKVPSSKK